MENKNISLLILIIISIVLSVYILLTLRESKESKVNDYVTLIDAITDNNRRLAEINRTMEQKRDTLKLIEKQKTIIEKTNRDNQNEIIKTHSIDSLIMLYYKYRRSDDSTKG